MDDHVYPIPKQKRPNTHLRFFQKTTKINAASLLPPPQFQKASSLDLFARSRVHLSAGIPLSTTKPKQTHTGDPEQSYPHYNRVYIALDKSSAGSGTKLIRLIVPPAFLKRSRARSEYAGRLAR